MFLQFFCFIFLTLDNLSNLQISIFFFSKNDTKSEASVFDLPKWDVHLHYFFDVFLLYMSFHLNCKFNGPEVLECAVVFLSLVVVSGHPQPSHRDGHPCTVDVLPGPTGGIQSPG